MGRERSAVARVASGVVVAALLSALLSALAACTPSPSSPVITQSGRATDGRPDSARYSGHYVYGFERSNFFPCPTSAGSAPPGEPWWLVSDAPGFFDRYEALVGDTDHTPGTGGESGDVAHTVFVTVSGLLERAPKDPPRAFGHLGAYRYQLSATALHDMSRTGQCP